LLGRLNRSVGSSFRSQVFQKITEDDNTWLGRKSLDVRQQVFPPTIRQSQVQQHGIKAATVLSQQSARSRHGVGNNAVNSIVGEGSSESP
jgi:hypothetical protein